jgi:hypothetical protein
MPEEHNLEGRRELRSQALDNIVVEQHDHGRAVRVAAGHDPPGKSAPWLLGPMSRPVRGRTDRDQRHRDHRPDAGTVGHTGVIGRASRIEAT